MPCRALQYLGKGAGQWISAFSNLRKKGLKPFAKVLSFPPIAAPAYILKDDMNDKIFQIWFGCEGVHLCPLITTAPGQHAPAESIGISHD
jgi:hypothetical protein